MHQIQNLFISSPPPLNSPEHFCHFARFPPMFLLLAMKKTLLKVPVPLNLVSLFLYLLVLSPFRLTPKRARKIRFDVTGTKTFASFIKLQYVKFNLVFFNVPFSLFSISKFCRIILNAIYFSGFLACISLRPLYGRWKFSNIRL